MFAYTRLPSLSKRILENVTNSFRSNTISGGSGATGGSGSGVEGGVGPGSTGSSGITGSSTGSSGTGSTASIVRTLFCLTLKLPLSALFVILISYGWLASVIPDIVCITTLLSLILVVTPGVISVPSSPINTAVRPVNNLLPDIVISCVPAPDTVVGDVENICGGR